MIGKSVLHIDKNSYYGENLATLKFNDFLKWLKCVHSFSDFYYTTSQRPFVSAKIPVSDENFSKRFNIDVSPHLLFSAGETVASLRNVAGAYIEFSSVDHIFVYIESKFVEVPLTKSDVFINEKLPLESKRDLYRLISALMGNKNEHAFSKAKKYTAERSKTSKCISNEMGRIYGLHPDLIKYINKPFMTLLTDYKLNEQLQAFLIYGVAFLDAYSSNTSNDTACNINSAGQKCLEVLPEINTFLRSLGVFSKLPFIYPNFGICDVVQSFCRVSSVFGGTFVLNFSPKRVSREQDGAMGNIKVTTCSDQIISCDDIICGSYYASKFLGDLPVECRHVTRSVCITNKSLNFLSKNFICVVPPNDPKIKNSFAVKMWQVSEEFNVCPKDYYLVYLSTPSHSKSEENIKSCANYFFDSKECEFFNCLDEIDQTNQNEKPELLFFAIYNEKQSRVVRDSELSKNKNIHVVDDSDVSLNLQYYHQQAEEIFKSLYPVEPFLEKKVHKGGDKNTISIGQDFEKELEELQLDFDEFKFFK